jgi:hypothetical protein
MKVVVLVSGIGLCLLFPRRSFYCLSFGFGYNGCFLDSSKISSKLSHMYRTGSRGISDIQPRAEHKRFYVFYTTHARSISLYF